MIGVKHYPNPFFDATTLSFTLENDEQLELRLYDLNGKIISIQKEIFPKGTNQWQLQAEQFSNHYGVLGYQLFNKNGLVGSGKLIRMKK